MEDIYEELERIEKIDIELEKKRTKAIKRILVWAKWQLFLYKMRGGKFYDS